jgi:hypothetical protein
MSTAAEAKAAFATEAALCDCFIASMREIGGWTIYPETAGFDILAVYDKTGHQLGIEAKLRLNAKVAKQILPGCYMGFGDWDVVGPDFRAVIVPSITEASVGIAEMLGILGVQVWVPQRAWSPFSERTEWNFMQSLNRHGGPTPDRREYDVADGELLSWERAWHDWNPPRRCELPEIVPSVRAGVPAPIQLTPWKIGALRVLADLEVHGFVTAKSVRAHGIDARRFCAADGWLSPLGEGRWGVGKMPRFDQQHPKEYAEILAAVRAQANAEAPA